MNHIIDNIPFFSKLFVANPPMYTYLLFVQIALERDFIQKVCNQTYKHIDNERVESMCSEYYIVLWWQ